MNASMTLYCRFCADHKLTHELIDLTSDQRIRNEIMEKLSIFASHDVDLHVKTLPETVCTQCIQSLNSSHDFFTKIRISQVVLSNFVSSILKLDSEDSSHSNDYSYSLDIKTSNDLPEIDESDSHVKIKTETIDLYSKVFEDACNATSMVSWPTYTWICRHCDVEVKSVEALREHSKESHNACFAFKCIDCSKDDFFDFDEFVGHVRTHRSELIQFCQYCYTKFEPDNTNHITAHKLQPHCYICGELFADDFTLLAHLSQYQKRGVTDVSWKEYDWVCRECNTKLANQDSLRLHVKEVHKKCFGMQCADCPQVMHSFSEFVDHVREHKPSLKYYCQYCNYRFVDAQLTIMHILSEHFNNQCDACGQSFPTAHDLRHHTNTYNQKRPKRVYKMKKVLTEKDLTCDICQKVTKSLNNLQSHKTLHTDRKRNYTCDRCGKAFFTKGTLKTHNVIHESPEPEVCRICKKTFLTRTRLKKHVKTHYAVKNFQCDTCNRCFRLKEQLKSHMACHSDVMPFACQHCDKTFRYRNVLKNHENQHTGARPYQCLVCNMEFANWSNCNKHMLRRHGTPLAKNALTPQGKVPINPKTGKPTRVDLAQLRGWTERLLAPRGRGRSKDDITSASIGDVNDCQL